MFESIFKDGTDLSSYLICLACALACGIISAVCASVKSRTTRSFITSLILLPPVVATVIIMVNGSIGTGIAVMGAFSLIRFRSVPGKASDIVSLFLTMTSGLACAAGFIWISLLFVALVGAVMVLLSFVPIGSDGVLDLRITVPESLHFADAFDDIFKEYTKSAKLVRTKTTNMGSLYKLEYKVRLKSKDGIQKFIDALRCRNGNLEISVSEPSEGSEEL